MDMAEVEANPSSPKQEEEKEKTKEGYKLLGSPTFKELENGRFKCLETGHECLSKDKESYSNSKRCRLGLIESFLSLKISPLNMFKQDPANKSKLICKLTGVTVNKSEEHIWKHIYGRKFLNKLEEKEKETGKVASNGVKEKEDEEEVEAKKGVKKDKKKKKKKKKDKKKKGVKKDVPVERVPKDDESPMEDNSESEELDFWIPPPGSRWDFDDGKDRWGSDTESGQDSDEGVEVGDDIEDEKTGSESSELSMRTKRMSIEVGPSGFASRKKKRKTKSTDPKAD
ncbi:surfeit locus protein 2-like isoform X2 [Papaver somniferum]|uniref:surfeit locus protein 2-like isoform X2 n=1 Tax=Papaver somniferum TaxID=3469 RepID=UPI000E6F998B|nr:surfeit locus protein 2-like isoform X2 [Papaver somniferum]